MTFSKKSSSCLSCFLQFVQTMMHIKVHAHIKFTTIHSQSASRRTHTILCVCTKIKENDVHLHVAQMEFFLRAMLSPQLQRDSFFFFVVFGQQTFLKDEWKLWIFIKTKHRKIYRRHTYKILHTFYFDARFLMQFFLLLSFRYFTSCILCKRKFFWFKVILTCIQQRDSALSQFPVIYRNAVSHYLPGVSLQHKIVS